MQAKPRRESFERAFPSRRRFVGSLGVVAAALTTAAVAGASPPAGEGPDAVRQSPDRAACLDAHRSAQELRKSGMLVEAGKKLLICASATCPGPIIADCGTWTGELQEATPSMVFEVEVDGHVASEAKITVDGVVVGDWSHALAVNPGTHQIRVEVPPFAPYEETVLMAEGHRMRLVSVKLATPKVSTSPSADVDVAKGSASGSERRPVPVVTYPLLAAGVAGLATFGVFAGLGRSKQTQLEHSCEPRCSDSDLHPMKTDYLVGDIALGVGAAALVSAAVVYFTRPREASSSIPVVSLDMGPTGADRKKSFWEASATMRW